MPRSLLLETYCGGLTVKIEGVGACVLDLTAEDATLFDYVERACAKLCAEPNGRPLVRTRPDDWYIKRFISEHRVLDVVQVAGEKLEPKPAAEEVPAGPAA